jgi:hypothetical protein
MVRPKPITTLCLDKSPHQVNKSVGRLVPPIVNDCASFYGVHGVTRSALLSPPFPGTRGKVDTPRHHLGTAPGRRGTCALMGAIFASPPEPEEQRLRVRLADALAHNKLQIEVCSGIAREMGAPAVADEIVRRCSAKNG